MNKQRQLIYFPTPIRVMSQFYEAPPLKLLSKEVNILKSLEYKGFVSIFKNEDGSIKEIKPEWLGSIVIGDLRPNPEKIHVAYLEKQPSIIEGVLSYDLTTEDGDWGGFWAKVEHLRLGDYIQLDITNETDTPTEGFDLEFIMNEATVGIVHVDGQNIKNEEKITVRIPTQELMNVKIDQVSVVFKKDQGATKSKIKISNFEIIKEGDIIPLVLKGNIPVLSEIVKLRKMEQLYFFFTARAMSFYSSIIQFIKQLINLPVNIVQTLVTILRGRIFAKAIKEYPVDLFNQIPAMFNPDDTVKVKALIFDIDKTLTKDGLSLIDGENLKQIIRALKLNIPVLLISGSPFLENEPDAFSDGTIPFGEEAIEVRVAQVIQEEMKKQGYEKYLKNLHIMGISGAEKITFDEKGDYHYNQDTQKFIDPVRQREIARVLSTGYLKVLSGNLDVDLNRDIEDISKAESSAEIRRIFDETIKKSPESPESDARFWPFNSEIAIYCPEDIVDGNEVLSEIKDRFNNLGIKKENGYFYSSGEDFFKVSRFQKADVVNDFVNSIEGEGAVIGAGDSSTDDFLRAEMEGLYFPVYLGKASDVANYPHVIVARDKKGSDDVQYTGTSVLIDNFLNAMQGKKTYKDLKFISNQYSLKEISAKRGDVPNFARAMLEYFEKISDRDLDLIEKEKILIKLFAKHNLNRLRGSPWARFYLATIALDNPTLHQALLELISDTKLSDLSDKEKVIRINAKAEEHNVESILLHRAYSLEVAVAQVGLSDKVSSITTNLHAGEMVKWVRYMADKTIKLSIPYSSIAEAIRGFGIKDITEEKTRSILQEFAKTTSDVVEGEARKLMPALFDVLCEQIIKKTGMVIEEEIQKPYQKEVIEKAGEIMESHELYDSKGLTIREIEDVGNVFIRGQDMYILARFMVENGKAILDLHEKLIEVLYDEHGNKPNEGLIKALIERELTLQKITQMLLPESYEGLSADEKQEVLHKVYDTAHQIFASYIKKQPIDKKYSRALNVLENIDIHTQIELIDKVEESIKDLITEEEEAKRFFESNEELKKSIEFFSEITEMYGYLLWKRLYDAAGKKSGELFSLGLLALKQMFSSDQLKEYWPGIVKLGEMSGEKSWEFFCHNLPALKQMFSSDELKEYWQDIVKLGEKSGEKSGELFKYDLPVLKYLINTRKDLVEIGEELIKLQKMSGEKSWELFYYGLPVLKHLIKTREDLVEIGEDLIELQKKSGEESGELFEYGLPALKYLIKTREDLVEIGEGLIELQKSGEESWELFKYGLSALKHLIKTREDLVEIGEGLIKLQKTSGEKSRELFDYGLPALKQMFSSDQLKEYWQDIVKLGETSGEKSRELFEYGLPALKHFIKTREDLVEIGEGLIKLQKTSGEKSRELFDYGLPALKQVFSSEQLKGYWQDIVKLGGKSGEKSRELFERVSEVEGIKSIDDVTVVTIVFEILTSLAQIKLLSGEISFKDLTIDD